MVADFERGRPGDEEPGDGLEQRGDAGRDRRDDRGSLHPFEAKWQRVLEGLGRSVQAGLGYQEALLEGTLAGIEADPPDELGHVRQLIERANVNRDLVDVRYALGDLERGGESHAAAWNAMEQGLRIADAAGGRDGSVMRFETRLCGARFAADAGDWPRCDRLLKEGDQALGEFRPEARRASPFGRDADALAKLSLCAVEYGAAATLLAQGDQPDCGDNEAAWFRFKAVEARHAPVPVEHRLGAAIALGLLIAELRIGKERSIGSTGRRAKSIAESFRANGDRVRDSQARLAVGRELATWSRRADWGRGDLLEAALDNVRLARAAGTVASTRSHTSCAANSVLGTTRWTESVLEGPRPLGKWRQELLPALRLLTLAGDTRSPVLLRQLDTGEVDLPPVPLLPPWSRQDSPVFGAA